MGRGLLLESCRSAAKEIIYICLASQPQTETYAAHKHKRVQVHVRTHTCKADAPNQTQCKLNKEIKYIHIDEQKTPSTRRQQAWRGVWPNQLCTGTLTSGSYRSTTICKMQKSSSSFKSTVTLHFGWKHLKMRQRKLSTPSLILFVNVIILLTLSLLNDKFQLGI